MKSTKINPQAPESEKKAMHLMQARNFFLQARSAVEQDHDWQSAGSLILQGLAEERKAQNSKVQVINVIRQRPKTRLEFNFRSWYYLPLRRDKSSYYTNEIS